MILNSPHHITDACFLQVSLSRRRFVIVLVCKQTKTLAFTWKGLCQVVSSFETLDGPWNYMLSVKQNRHAWNSIFFSICPGQITVKIWCVLIELRFIHKINTSCRIACWNTHCRNQKVVLQGFSKAVGFGLMASKKFTFSRFNSRNVHAIMTSGLIRGRCPLWHVSSQTEKISQIESINC